MAIFEWRKFNFFDLHKGADKGQISLALKDSDIKCSTYGNGQIFIGDSHGYIFIFKKDWSFRLFKAHDGPVLLNKFCRSINLLVTIGSEEIDGNVASSKIWNFAKSLDSTSLPNCLRVFKIPLQKPTALDISENGQLMAIGFDRGSVSLYRGDLGRERPKNCKTLSCGMSAIKGIAFKLSDDKAAQMFVCSDSGVLVYKIYGRDREEKIILYDGPSVPVGCSALQTTGWGHFMVGHENAIYCYTTDDKGPCYVLEGEKTILEWFRSHLLAVLSPTRDSTRLQKSNHLTVIDIKNKFIVFSAQIDSVAAIIIEFGSCFVLTKNKDLYHLDEKDLQTKLNVLFKKNLYDIAVRVAKSSEYDAENLAYIFRQYGDHLYSKNDFNGAAEQYMKTIRYVEPSYVIRKFLDSRHIDCLTAYLEELHRAGYATADHTTLLLNCFTRLEKNEKLAAFLENDATPDLVFDIDTAIKVCRSASKDQALTLAKRNRRHDQCISILIEDKQDYEEAIRYISSINVTFAEKNLLRYGSELMKNLPMETTNLIKKICSEKVHDHCDPNTMELNSMFTEHVHGNRANFLHLFNGTSDELIDFLEFIIRLPYYCGDKVVFNTLIETYLRKWVEVKQNDCLLEATKIESYVFDLLHKHYSELDQNHVLMLCQAYHFDAGVMWIYEEEKLHHLIVRFYLRERQYNKLLDTCNRLGKNRPSLWLQALSGLRDDHEAPSTTLVQILSVIAQQKLQSPLQVLECLSMTTEESTKLDAVREYFLQIFNKGEESFKREEELAKQYRNDTVHWKKHIENLCEKPIEFKGNTCNNCNQPLSIPAVYFFCQHSFHVDCVRGYSETEKDCPVCHSKNRGIIDALMAQHEAREQHENFHSLLDRSTEPFSIVAEYFGRGLFNKLVIFDEDDVKAREPVHQNVSANKSSIPIPNYGKGAEAKIRLNETKTAKSSHVLSEGKMRIQEGRGRNVKVSNFGCSLEENIDWSGVKQQRKENSPSSKTKHGATTHQPAQNYPSNSNPFSDHGGDVDSNASIASKRSAYDKALDPFAVTDDYDDCKNPFAEESQGPKPKYDKNLNPFE